MNIGYVCTNYNNTAYTRDAVASLWRSREHQYQIVVVDNNSNEENIVALQQLARDFQHVELILNKDNSGYFGGLNIGIRHLRSNHPELDFMVVGNNDLVFPDGFGESLQSNLSVLETHSVVSPNIVTLDGIHQNPHVISKISTFRELIYSMYYANYHLAIAIRHVAKATRSFTERPDANYHNIAGKIYQGYGACYILGPVFFRYFEELWAPTFLMHEEFFLSKQLSDKGLSVYYEPSIKVLHCRHGAMGAVPPRKAWEAARAARKIYRRYVRLIG